MITVACYGCARVYRFKQDSRGYECGHAWISVELYDGAAPSPLMTGRQFCSPGCVARFFSDPSELGTITFPEPLEPLL